MSTRRSTTSANPLIAARCNAVLPFVFATSEAPLSIKRSQHSTDPEYAACGHHSIFKESVHSEAVFPPHYLSLQPHPLQHYTHLHKLPTFQGNCIESSFVIIKSTKMNCCSSFVVTIINLTLTMFGQHINHFYISRTSSL